MARYSCRICKRKFSSSSGFTQHANAVHHGRRTLSISQRSQHIEEFQHDPYLWSLPITLSRTSQRSQKVQIVNQNLWSTPITVVEMSEEGELAVEQNLWNMLITVVEMSEEGELAKGTEPNYNLQGPAMEIDPSAEIIGEDSEESSEESLIDLEEAPLDPKDLQGATLEDALETIEGKNKPECIAKWPNNVYCNFMELVIKSNISNTKLFQKSIPSFSTSYLRILKLHALCYRMKDQWRGFRKPDVIRVS